MRLIAGGQRVFDPPSNKGEIYDNIPYGCGQRVAAAMIDDVTRLTSDIDKAKMLDVMKLHMSVADREEAVLWMAGDPDIFGPGDL